MPPKKRKQPEELCVACVTNPAEISQQECGHCVLCSTCAFRIYSEDRRCPSCRSAMLFPLVRNTDVSAEPFSPAVAITALRYAEEAVTAAVGNAEGVLQSLNAVLPRIPAKALPRWFTAMEKTCKALRRDSIEAVASTLVAIGASCSEDVWHEGVAFLAKHSRKARSALMLLLVKAPQPVSATEPGVLLLRALEDHLGGLKLLEGPLSQVTKGEPSALSGVVAAMRAFPSARAVAEQGTAAIETFCDAADAAGLAWAAAAGCGEALAQALLAHPRCAAVQESGCSAAHSLLYTNDADDTRMAPATTASIGLAAVAALRAHSASAMVVMRALGALMAVSFLKGFGEGLVAAGAVGAVIATLKQHLAEADIQDYAMMTLNNSLCNLDETGTAAVTAAEAASCFALAVAALSARAGISDVIVAACSLLDHIMAPNEGGVSLMGDLRTAGLPTAAPGLAADLVGALPGLDTAASATEAINVLTHLCACPGWREKVVAAGAAAAAKAAAAKYPDSEGVAEAAADLDSALEEA